MEVFRLKNGASPLVVSIPHSGTYLPEPIVAQLSDAGKAIADTDWHLNEVYDCLDDLDVTVIAATHSRYVIDLNRPADGSPLYAGHRETALCPLGSFAGEPLYRPGCEPTVETINERIRQYWQPYHDQLAATLESLRARHGFAVLWDAHSIRSRVPMFFDGVLPDLNFGTNQSRSCDYALAKQLVAEAERSGRYSVVSDQRFKGGYITRTYGNPARGIHAIQLEMVQKNYMEELPPWRLLPGTAAGLSEQLRELLSLAAGWHP